jgi:transcriptional regulator with XRE-family HTH domain
MAFADRLRELREEAGLTQAALAERSGLPLGSVRGYEQGQREPLWTVIYRLADALGVSCEKFKPSPPVAPPARRRRGRKRAC